MDWCFKCITRNDGSSFTLT